MTRERIQVDRWAKATFSGELRALADGDGKDFEYCWIGRDLSSLLRVMLDQGRGSPAIM